MRKLHVSRRFSLPIDFVTQRTSILGKTRSGKSHTAGVMVEEVLKARQQVVVLDPKGDWYGLRSSADGKEEGLPITIMGGKRGDIPLEPTAGALVADVIISEGISVVLDLSLFESKADEIRFVTAFLDRLYRKNERPLLLVIDEADTFAPQRPEKNETVMLNRMETICRRGAGRGIGVVLVSQRSAAIHKGCLSQTELMVAHQTTAPQDKDAVKAWVVNHGDEERRKAFMERITKLPVGTAIFWSPSWLEIYREEAVRAKETYDSSATPRVGHRRKPPKVLARIDLERLKRHMAETIEKAKNEDPKLLHGEIARLKAELAAAKRAQSPKPAPPAAPRTVVRTETETKVVKIPAVTGAEAKRIEKLLVRMEKFAGRLGPISDLQTALWSETKRLSGALSDAVEAAEKLGKTPPRPAVRPAARPAAAKAISAPPPRIRPAAVPEEAGENGELSKPRLNILRALVEFESIGMSSVPRHLVAGWLGLVCSGSFMNNVYALRSRGYVAEGKELALTEEGRTAAPPPEAEPTTEGILDHCMRAVNGPRGAILKRLHGIHPEWTTREQLAADLGLAYSGSFMNNVYSLHSAGMAEFGEKSGLKCADWMFVGEAAVR